jgi:hypothetical protein
MTTPLLTTEQAAELLAITPYRMRRIRRERRIDAVNVGTERRPEWRYTRVALDAYQRRNTTKAA